MRAWPCSTQGQRRALACTRPRLPNPLALPPPALSCCAGFQTHTTPVLMSAGERAELGSEQYLPLSPILEGTVILKPNPDYVEVTE